MDKVEDQLRRAKEHLFYWQPQLRLDHIDFEITTAGREESYDKLADCNIAPARHRQRIKLRHPEDKTESDDLVFRRDLEVVVVHELLHTKEAPWRDHPTIDEIFRKDKWLTQLHEDSLDAMAEALVRARRGMTR